MYIPTRYIPKAAPCASRFLRIMRHRVGDVFRPTRTNERHAGARLCFGRDLLTVGKHLYPLFRQRSLGGVSNQPPAGVLPYSVQLCWFRPSTPPRL